MKTKAGILADIEVILKRDLDLKIKTKKVIVLRNIILYLQTNPREEFVKKSIEDLQRKLNVLENRFVSGNIKRKEHNELYNIITLKQQLKNLKYICQK